MSWIKGTCFSLFSLWIVFLNIISSNEVTGVEICLLNHTTYLTCSDYCCRDNVQQNEVIYCCSQCSKSISGSCIHRTIYFSLLVTSCFFLIGFLTCLYRRQHRRYSYEYIDGAPFIVAERGGRIPVLTGYPGPPTQSSNLSGYSVPIGSTRGTQSLPEYQAKAPQGHAPPDYSSINSKK